MLSLSNFLPCSSVAFSNTTHPSHLLHFFPSKSHQINLQLCVTTPSSFFQMQFSQFHSTERNRICSLIYLILCKAQPHPVMALEYIYDGRQWNWLSQLVHRKKLGFGLPTISINSSQFHVKLIIYSQSQSYRLWIL